LHKTAKPEISVVIEEIAYLNAGMEIRRTRELRCGEKNMIEKSQIMTIHSIIFG
jgi:hypothetical protein